MTNEKYPLIDPLIMESEIKGETPGSPEVVERIESERERRGYLTTAEFFKTMISLRRLGGDVVPWVKRWLEVRKR